MVLLLPTAQGDFSPFFGNFLKIFSFSKILTFPLFFIPLMRGVCLSSLRLFKISFFPFDAGGGSFLSFLPFFKILIFPSTRSGRAGPLLSGLQKVGKDRRKGVSPPCESPDQSGVLDAPLWKPPSLRARQTWPNSSPLRGWSFGADWGRPRARARSPRPHLHRFAGAHDRRTFPNGERLPVMRGGLAPPDPRVPRWGGRSCAPAHGTRPIRLCGNAFANLPEAPAAQAARSSVTPLARLWPQATLARPLWGESQRGRSPLWPVFAYFLLARK